jgi:hypothetical protein
LIRHRCETYLDKVFGFSDLVSALPEGRQFPQHSWKKGFDAVFLGAAMQIPSLLQIEAECHHGALARRIGAISDDTLGYSLERQSPEPVFALSCEIARRLQRNGVLRSDWSRGLGVGAVDGIEICSSFARCCAAWMEREVQHQVNHEMKTEIQYYHRIVVVVLVSTSFPIPLGVRFQKNGEGEVACALALLQDLVGHLGRRFLDVLVGDALYLQTSFVKQMEPLGLIWAFTWKENQPDVLREAERCTQDSPYGVQAEPGGNFATGTYRTWIGPSPIAGCGSSKRFASNPSAASRSAKKTLLAPKARRKGYNRAPTSTPPISNWDRSRRCSSISSAAAVGESTPKSFRPSPPTVTSNTPPSTKPRPWWC